MQWYAAECFMTVCEMISHKSKLVGVLSGLDFVLLLFLVKFFSTEDDVETLIEFDIG